MQAVVTSGTALIAATYGLARFGYGLSLPSLTRTFEMSSVAAGAISAGSFVSYCLSAAVASRMGGHPRTMVICAGGAATVGSLGVAAAPALSVLAPSVLIAGAGAGFASPGLVALIQRNVAPARQENAQTIVNSGTGAGIVAAGALMLLTIGQWRLAWLTVAVLSLLATTATLRADKSTAQHQVSKPPPPRRAGQVSELAALTWPTLAATLAGISSAAVWTFGPSIMATAQSGRDNYATLAWMVLGAFGILGATAGKIVQTWSLKTAWGITCVAMSAATVLLGLWPGAPVPAYTAVAAFGATYTAMSGVLIVWAVRVTPARAAEGTIVLFIALAVGQALGSATFGLLQGFLAHGAVFTLAGVVGLLSLVPAMKGPTRSKTQATR